MAKRSLKYPMEHEKEHSGCIWGLISIFDFRHGQSTRKLIPDRKQDSKPEDCVEHSRTKIKTPTNFEEKCQNNEDGKECETTIAKAVKTSVKEFMEEEMICDEDSKRKINSDGAKLEQFRNNCKQTNQTNKKSNVPIYDLGAVGNVEIEMISHQVADKKPSEKPDLGVIIEELENQIHQKGAPFIRLKCDDDLDIQLKRSSVSEEKLSAAIDVFMDLRVTNSNHLKKDGKGLYSNEFMGALQTLSANKELLLKFLQDPNSQLVKHIEDMEDAQLEKGQNSNFLIDCKLCKDDTSVKRPEELSIHKRHNFFRRRSKSQESFPLTSETFQAQTKIVILKPGPADSQNSGTEINVSKSLQSHCNIKSKIKCERNLSPFSFTDIKRKLKSVMRKEQHRVVSEGTAPWFPNEHQKSKNSENYSGIESGGMSSPNRSHLCTENFNKSSVGKSRENIGILKNTMGYLKHEKSNIYIEAKKHLSEMLTNGVEDAELITGQMEKTLGRILPLPEDTFSPICSPGIDRELSFVTAKMRLHPQRKPHVFNKNVGQLIEDNHAIHFSSSWKNSEDQELTTENNSKEEYSSSNPDVSYELNHESPVEEAPSFKGNVPGSSGVLTFETTADIQNEKHNEILNVSCKSSNSLVMSDFQNCDSDVVESSSNPLVTGKVKDQESFFVFKPFGTEYINPKTTTIQFAIQPVRINSEEQGSSTSDQGIYIGTCMENKESTFEYMEAVLLGSGLNWDEFLLRWISSDQLLGLSLFDEVETCFNQTSHEKKLLFDCTNEVLMEVCNRSYGSFPWASNLKKNIRPVPQGMNLISEVWKGVERNMLQQLTSHSMDQLIRKDMEKSASWMDCESDIENIIIEIGVTIIDELMEDL